MNCHRQRPQPFAAQLYDGPGPNYRPRTGFHPDGTYPDVVYTLRVYVRDGHYEYLVTPLARRNTTSGAASWLQGFEPAETSIMFAKQWREFRVAGIRAVQVELAQLRAAMTTAQADPAYF